MTNRNFTSALNISFECDETGLRYITTGNSGHDEHLGNPDIADRDGFVLPPSRIVRGEGYTAASWLREIRKENLSSEGPEFESDWSSSEGLVLIARGPKSQALLEDLILGCTCGKVVLFDERTREGYKMELLDRTRAETGGCAGYIAQREAMRAQVEAEIAEWLGSTRGFYEAMVAKEAPMFAFFLANKDGVPVGKRPTKPFRRNEDGELTVWFNDGRRDGMFGAYSAADLKERWGL